MAHDVFISYANHDKPTADAVCAGLEVSGVRCWIAPRDIVPGTSWPRAIPPAINNSRVMVLIFSAHANQSEYVIREVTLAANARIPIIPFRIEKIEPVEDLAFFLATPHWLDAIDEPLAAHIRRLTESVIALLGMTPVAPIGNVMVHPKDGAKMVWVPAGMFFMGSSDAEIARWCKDHPADKPETLENEKPQHALYLDGYWIYQHDVTVAQYRNFCEETGRQMPVAPGWGWIDDHPIVRVSWEDAHAYAEWAGAALPTEAEWEKAARGTDGRIYPWGNEWDVSKCSNAVEYNPGQTRPIDTYPSGDSPYGCSDMAGNVWQWCADWYGEDYYRHSPAVNPSGPESGTSGFCVASPGTVTIPGLFVLSVGMGSFRRAITVHRFPLCGALARTIMV